MKPTIRERGFTVFLGVEGTNQLRKDGVLFLDSQVRMGDISDGTSNTLIVGERPLSPDGIFGWWYAGWGQAKNGAADMVLGVRELMALDHRYSWEALCSDDGPYHFTAGRSDNPCDIFHFWSLHSGGAHFLFADGSVHFLAYSADSILPALATRYGGETAPLP